MSMWIVTWLLGLSFVSDFIKRHAVERKRGEPSELPRWVQWGRTNTGNVSCSGEYEFTWFLKLRLPGVYWEPYYKIINDSSECVWCHKWLYWASKSAFGDNMLHGWHEFFVPIDSERR